ncbi:beta-glucuronosyltransferase GlcAT14A [Hordeum vulgare subsp. vulgare]|uniref:Beta-glucuronosyltransferase GlcAT14A n=1 Tax=Hordeum vulgare subsp. vulgare TaxID=112509 RepID=A0A8I6Y447_HORVV|nr:beta-glucuronosyltransferase GlcAT14A [Hordeum vulgare subsp. vulgare]
MHSPAPAAGAASVLPKDSRPLPCLLLVSLLLLLLLHFLSSSSPSSTPAPPDAPHRPPLPAGAASAGPAPPALAFLLTGSAGDADRLHRLLLATYHPRNLYLLLLDRATSAHDRVRLARELRAGPGRAGNVHVVGDPGFANPRGASALAAVLHGASLLLRLGQGWDWFVHLDAGDYPLVTPDDLLHVLSYLPKDINFIQHTSYIGWKESRHIRPIVVDPGLYLSSRTDIFYATQKRELPSAYKLFTGSSSVILSREFTEYCIVGTNNLPRTMLMYYTNMPLPHRKYFQTVLCNSPKFNRTVVNHDLHYWASDGSSKNEPRLLNLTDAGNMAASSAAFGTRFAKDDPVLDHIDEEILQRLTGEPAPGGWCIGAGDDSPCSVSGSTDVLRPGPAAMKLAKFLAKRLSYPGFYSQQCVWD